MEKKDNAQRPLADFETFWIFYLNEHRNRTNRILHYWGTTLGSLTAIVCLIQDRPQFLPLALLFGYGPPWIGHFFFEKNKPASFRHPLWSLRADFRMFYRWLTRQLPSG